MSIRSLTVLRAALTTLAIALSVGPEVVRAGALTPIDDFETGGFTLQTMFGNSFVQDSVAIPGSGSHAIAAHRKLQLQAHNMGPQTFASLVPGTFVDDCLNLDVSNAGSAQLRYDMTGPQDLTCGGTVSAIEMDLNANQSGFVSVTISDGVSQSGFSRSIATPGRQTLQFPISMFTPGLPGQATSIWFHFPPNQNGTFYQVHDIRLRGTGSATLDLVGTTASSSTPPVPAPPLVFSAVDPVLTTVEYAVEAAIGDALTSAQTVPAGNWTWAGSGQTAEMSFLWTEPGGVLQTDFDLTVRVYEEDGLAPDLYPPDPIHDAETVLLAFPVALRDGSGAVQRVCDTRMTIDVGPNQAGTLEILNVTVTENQALRSWTDGFTVSFTLALTGQGTPDGTEALFTAGWLSTTSSQVATGAALPGVAGGEGALRLVRAVPGVTREGTEIRASGPFPRGASVGVHDVAGRLVNRLETAEGSRAVRWDGRARGGAVTPSGVYFVRLDGDADAGAVRVIRLR